MAEHKPKPDGKRGPPNKAQQIKNKKHVMKVKLEAEMLSGNQMLVKNYNKYLAILDDIAQGKGDFEKASIPSRSQCAKILLDKTEEILQKETKKSDDEEEVSSDKQDASGEVVSLISLNAPA